MAGKNQTRQTSQRKIVFRLKTAGPQTADALAKVMKMSPVAVRQHLSALFEDDFVEFEDKKESVGRPRRYWSVSSNANKLFPDTHSFLTVELIDAIQKEFGERGLDNLISRTEKKTLVRYKQTLKSTNTLAAKVKALAAVRDADGYMAAAEKVSNKEYRLLENHCPICAAASVCQGFCRSELALFRKVLGRKIEVERTEHIVAGARRCAYSIRER